MSHRLALVTLASGNPMGQQVYDRQLTERAPSELGARWNVDQVQVRTLRSPLEGTARVPARLLADAPDILRRAAGLVLYRGHDVVHHMDLRLPPAPRPEVLTVHDVAPWRFPDEGRPVADVACSARRAAAVICPSQFAADEVAGQLGVCDPVPIPYGVDDRFFGARSLEQDALTARGIHPSFALLAGGCTERKNLTGLAAAWALLQPFRPDTQLVLIGPADSRRDRLFADLPGTVRIGRVDDATALGVMAAASVVVVPSLYEGFGLPVLEGMALGVPVVAVRRSSLPEVCGDAAYLVEPDGTGLAEGLAAALDHGSDTVQLVERGRRRAERFTWAASVAAHADIWRRYGS